MKLIKQLFFCFCLLIFTCNINAQTTAAKTTTTHYISHTVKAGETLTLLSKQYNTTVGTIMRFNHMSTNSVLTVGELVKIPVPKPVAAKVATIDSLAVAPAIPGNMIPVTHIVGRGESLSSLAKKYHTTISQIKTWNNLKSDIIIDGHTLIVGYAGTNNSMAPAQNNTQQQADGMPQRDTSMMQTQMQMTHTEQDAIAPKTVSQNLNSPQTIAAPDVSSATTSQVQQPSVDMSNIPAIGYFSSSFGLGMQDRGLETVSGTSMTFKTTSGWNDRKYYILINNVPPGSIVRVNSADNKIIYAKVLGTMTGIKENEGIDYRISTAAAAALGLSDAKFPLTVTFYE
jgi:LysM repeat protein